MLTMLAEDKKASLPLDVELPCFNAAYIFTSFFEEVYLSISFKYRHVRRWIQLEQGLDYLHFYPY